jgi:hypothetical protein
MCLHLFRRAKAFPREYADLINEATGKWPNWYPARIVHVSVLISSVGSVSRSYHLPRTKQVGDFGTLDEKSGELWAEGNIYTHNDTIQLASEFPSVQEPEIDHYKIHSNEVQELDVGTEPGA